MHVKIMESNKNDIANGAANVENMDKGVCKVKYVSKIASNLSLFCSFVGMSLFGAIFLGIADILDFRNTKVISDCGNYLVVSASILFFFAFILSRFKEEDSVQNDPAILQTDALAKIVLAKNHTSNVITETSRILPKELKSTNCKNGVEHNIMSGETKSKKNSSKTLQLDAFTQKRNGTKSLFSNISSKILHSPVSKQKECGRTLSSSALYGTSKQGESTSLSSNTSSGMSKQEESARTLSLNTLSGTSKQGESAKTLTTKSQSQNFNEKRSREDMQLIPYKKQPENPSHLQRNMQVVPSFSFPSFCNFTPIKTFENSPTAEVVTTKKVTYLPGGIAQEEYQIKQTFFRWPGGGVHAQNLLNPDQNNRTPSSMFSQANKNVVSNLLTKFESMNMLP